MNNIKDKVILMDSTEAASIKTVTGWTSSDGRFFGNNEDLARYAGSTHRKCHNNPEHPIYPVNSYCDICHAENRKEKFHAFPRKQWEGEPLTIDCDDRFFFDADDLRDYCTEHLVLPHELELVICEPNYPSEIDGNDFFCDSLPDDGELPSELQEAFDALNAAIRKSGPLSWSAGKYAVIIPDDFLDAEIIAEIKSEREA
ncbi:hypothetical protein B4902_06615 [Yersinia frederiksenii]|uniref:hypothetical protein n=1 Tax=Yersinia frederiksenii TaxID=29484 RepID=UPI000B48F720|nr:hypothetical protein [Yersinia frederiksenii]OWF73668.1 hypothetical protein B4902_06615 [Yersinia frederiksenii]